jgi:hypothetical protein
VRSAGNLLRYPITGTPGSCARAANGYAAAAPPTRVMNSRLFIQLPRTALFARFSATSGRSDFSLALIVGFGLRPSRRGPGADDGGKLIVRHCIQLGVQLRLH